MEADEMQAHQFEQHEQREFERKVLEVVNQSVRL